MTKIKPKNIVTLEDQKPLDSGNCPGRGVSLKHSRLCLSDEPQRGPFVTCGARVMPEIISVYNCHGTPSFTCALENRVRCSVLSAIVRLEDALSSWISVFGVDVFSTLGHCHDRQK